MSEQSLRFLGLLLLILIGVFGVHLLSLNSFNLPLFANQIWMAYILNYIMAGIVLFLVQRNLKAQSAQTGFIFLAGSTLKFAVFFLVFYPSYKADGAMETIEFITFFVPYVTCLITEVIYLSKQLNNQ